MMAMIILFPVIWLVEGRRGKVSSPVVGPSRAMQTLATPAAQADARSLEIQDQIEAQSRQIAWEQIRAANHKREDSARLSSTSPRTALYRPSRSRRRR
jgi:hypothetical protein